MNKNGLINVNKDYNNNNKEQNIESKKLYLLNDEEEEEEYNNKCCEGRWHNVLLKIYIIFFNTPIMLLLIIVEWIGCYCVLIESTPVEQCNIFIGNDGINTLLMFCYTIYCITGILVILSFGIEGFTHCLYLEYEEEGYNGGYINCCDNPLNCCGNIVQLEELNNNVCPIKAIYIQLYYWIQTILCLIELVWTFAFIEKKYQLTIMIGVSLILNTWISLIITTKDMTKLSVVENNEIIKEIEKGINKKKDIKNKLMEMEYVEEEEKQEKVEYKKIEYKKVEYKKENKYKNNYNKKEEEEKEEEEDDKEESIININNIKDYRPGIKYPFIAYKYIPSIRWIPFVLFTYSFFNMTFVVYDTIKLSLRVSKQYNTEYQHIHLILIGITVAYRITHSKIYLEKLFIMKSNIPNPLN